MNYVGKPLARRMDRTTNKIKFTTSEWYVDHLVVFAEGYLSLLSATLRNILRGIHTKAAVLHRDLRSWNVMVSDAGELTIIDFDRAKLGASKEQLAEEADRLRRFLKGDFVDKDPVIGSGDVPSDIDERIKNPSVVQSPSRK